MTAPTLELEELALAFPVSLDLRAIATPHALAMAADLAGLALPAGSIVRGVTSTLCEFHVGHRLELSVPTAAGYAVAALERRQLTPAHPVEWTLSYQQRAGSSNRTHHRGDAGELLLELLLELAEGIAAAQTPEPEPPRRRRKAAQ